jgi:hypothetical protein
MSSNEDTLPNVNDAVTPGASASAGSAPVAPRRDKLAAMAHRAAAANTTTSTSDGIATTDMDVQTPNTAPSQQVETPASATASGGRGSNKLAALAARQMQQQANNVDSKPISSTAPKAGKHLTRLLSKESVLPSSNESQQPLSQQQERKQLSPEELAKKKAEYLTTLQERMKKRNQLLNDLDQAEEMTCQLLSIAAQTTDALQNVHWPSDGTGTLSRLSTAYASTIQAIHPLISGNNNDDVAAETLVKAYQNHGTEAKQSMYAARIELRLAAERCQVLKTFAELERQEQKEQDDKRIQIDDKSRKRSREK